MKNTLFILSLLVSIHSYSLAQLSKKAKTKPDTTERSGINSIALDSIRVTNIYHLGLLWGFIKYHHPAVCRGKFDMDKELFNVLPKVLTSGSTLAANAVLEKWVNHFGIPNKLNTGRKTYNPDQIKFQPDYGAIFTEGTFTKTLQAKLKYILAHGDTSSDHYYIGLDWYVGNPNFKNEKEYASPYYPDAGVRLLALFRYWNMIRYYYPYRNLMHENWDSVLITHIAPFCRAGNVTEYINACSSLVSQIHDGHAGMGGKSYYTNMGGSRFTPLIAEFIEGKLTVIYVYDTLNLRGKIKPGFLIEKINNISVDSLVKLYAKTVSASSHSNLLTILAGSSGKLLTTNDTCIILTVNDGESVHDITIPTMPFKCKKFPQLVGRAAPYEILDGNIGYINAPKLIDTDIDPLIAQLSKTKCLIFDMRAHPRMTFQFYLGKWLKCRSTAFVRFTRMCVATPGMCIYRDSVFTGSDDSTCYKGKVLILVDQHSFSAAEYVAMSLASVPGALVIGDTTAGADGNVSFISLPGALKTVISGVGVLYPDGTETQRTGVKIDRLVRRTINGVKNGMDEQLEYAIKLAHEN